MKNKELLKRVIKLADGYGHSDLDFRVVLDKFDGDVAIVRCWNDGDGESDAYLARVRVVPEPGRFHLLEVQHAEGEPQIVGASGHTLCAILYV